MWMWNQKMPRRLFGTKQVQMQFQTDQNKTGAVYICQRETEKNVQECINISYKSCGIFLMQKYMEKYFIGS